VPTSATGGENKGDEGTHGGGKREVKREISGPSPKVIGVGSVRFPSLFRLAKEERGEAIAQPFKRGGDEEKRKKRCLLKGGRKESLSLLSLFDRPETERGELGFEGRGESSARPSRLEGSRGKLRSQQCIRVLAKYATRRWEDKKGVKETAWQGGGRGGWTQKKEEVVDSREAVSRFKQKKKKKRSRRGAARSWET